MSCKSVRRRQPRHDNAFNGHVSISLADYLRLANRDLVSMQCRKPNQPRNACTGSQSAPKRRPPPFRRWILWRPQHLERE